MEHFELKASMNIKCSGEILKLTRPWAVSVYLEWNLDSVIHMLLSGTKNDHFLIKNSWLCSAMLCYADSQDRGFRSTDIVLSFGPSKTLYSHLPVASTT